MASDAESRRKHKLLEGLNVMHGKEIYMELRGDPPLAPGGNEIALKGVIVDSVEFKGPDSSVTIRIPLSNLAAFSESPLTQEQRAQAEQQGQ